MVFLVALLITGVLRAEATLWTCRSIDEKLPRFQLDNGVSCGSESLLCPPLYIFFFFFLSAGVGGVLLWFHFLSPLQPCASLPVTPRCWEITVGCAACHQWRHFPLAQGCNPFHCLIYQNYELCGCLARDTFAGVNAFAQFSQ